MTGRQLSNAAKHAAYQERSKDAWIILLTISSEGWTDDVRIASDPMQLLPVAGVRGVVSRGLEFIFAPFAFELPGENEGGTGAARISIDAVDRRMIQIIRSATKAIRIKAEVVISSRVNAPQTSINGFRLDNADYDRQNVTIAISMGYYDQEPFPYGRFVPSKFRSMF